MSTVNPSIKQHYINELNRWANGKSPEFRINILTKVRNIYQRMFLKPDHYIASTFSCTEVLNYYGGYVETESYFLDKLLDAMVCLYEGVILRHRYIDMSLVGVRHGHAIPYIAKELGREEAGYHPYVNKQKCILRKRYMSFVINHCNITIKQLEKQL